MRSAASISCERIAASRLAGAGTADELREQAGEDNLEDAFVKVIGSEEGLVA